MIKKYTDLKNEPFLLKPSEIEKLWSSSRFDKYFPKNDNDYEKACNKALKQIEKWIFS